MDNRLPSLSSSEMLFKESKTHYQDNLRQSGWCNNKLTYKPTDTNQQIYSKQKRWITWPNPPFSKNVFRKIFFKHIRPTFIKSHISNIIFNRSKIKISYSYMQNTKSITNNHSIKFLKNTTKVEKSCNCRNRNNCPQDGKCLTSNMIYEAQITSNKPNYKEKFFKETAETDFKHRFNNNHTKSFSDMELSREHWTIKRNHFTLKDTWRSISLYVTIFWLKIAERQEASSIKT